jgi:hypothetical protein
VEPAARRRPPDVASSLAKTVVFLFHHKDSLPERPPPLGTGFIIGYPDPDQPDVYVPLLVTARHNLSGKGKLIVRYSTKAGRRPFHLLCDLEEMKRIGDIWEHDDPGVDITVVRVPHPQESEYEPFPLSLVASAKQFEALDIKATDRVIYPTLLRYFTGESRNYPVMRDGMIALIADEPIPVRSSIDDERRDSNQVVILLDGMSIPGTSGSPVFLSPIPRRRRGNLDLGGTQPWLLGVMHGFALADSRVVVEAGVTPSQVRENAGIAVVFPSWRILEIVYSDQAQRRLGEILEVIHTNRHRP